jgi:hypothetical protein
VIHDLIHEAQAVIYAVGFACLVAITVVCGLFAWLDSRERVDQDYVDAGVIRASRARDEQGRQA